MGHPFYIRTQKAKHKTTQTLGEENDVLVPISNAVDTKARHKRHKNQRCTDARVLSSHEPRPLVKTWPVNVLDPDSSEAAGTWGPGGAWHCQKMLWWLTPVLPSRGLQPSGGGRLTNVTVPCTVIGRVGLRGGAPDLGVGGGRCEIRDGAQSQGQVGALQACDARKGFQTTGTKP